jgi:ribosome-associated heat shock protein Hsp15
MDTLRVDKWLWAARFFKTRSLAQDEVERGRVRIAGRDIKPSRELRAGDCVDITVGTVTRSVVVKGVSSQRGPAPVAQALYEETAESVVRRERAALAHKLAPEPGLDARGRPTKRERRDLDNIKQKFAGERFDW